MKIIEEIILNYEFGDGLSILKLHGSIPIVWPRETFQPSSPINMVQQPDKTCPILIQFLDFGAVQDTWEWAMHDENFNAGILSLTHPSKNTILFSQQSTPTPSNPTPNNPF